MPLDFQVKKDEEARVELTPLIDVIFQLLVFFMLSSTFLFPNLELVLPKLDEDPDDRPEQPRLVINMDAAGDIFLNSEPIDRPRFVASLRQALIESDLNVVFFRGDQGLSYAEVIRVMREASEAGAVQFNFLYDPNT